MLITLPPTEHPWSPLKIAILSGLSDPATCALSAVQRDFLKAMDAPESAKVYSNFPYVDSPARHAPPLWLASWNNARQYLGASRQPYVTHARRHWQALRNSAGHLLVITLSCGMEILRHCIDDTDTARPLHILALGPVARSLPRVPCTVVQGTRDPVSRLFFPSRAQHPPLAQTITIEGLGHLDYFRSPAIHRIASELLCGSTLNSSAAVSISRSTS